ncbi:hypothetical protein [Streptomyces sp. DSM 41534]
MRWLMLYARSRQAPASAAALTLILLVVWALTRGEEGLAAGPRIAALVLAAGVATAAAGLGGPDVALERTAAIRWAPRRAAHILLIGTLIGAGLMASQAAGSELAPAAFIIRDSAGMAGLAGLGAAVCGASHAWVPLLGWVAFALFVPAPTGITGRIAGWPLLPPGTAAGTWTALILLIVGTVLYAAAGPKR